MTKRYFLLIVFSLLTSPSYLICDETRGVQVLVEDLDPTLKVGKQYVAVIAVNNYQRWMPLKSPVRDAKELRDVLVSRYYIDEVYELYDEEATKANIIRLFVHLQQELQTNDSLLVIYAGHGHLDKNTNTGFWIPVNAGTDEYEQHNWLPHTQIKGLILNIEATHLCLISDSCFAGDLLNITRSITPSVDNEYFKKAYSRVSRQILTSGATETVPDVSEFANQLKLALKRNESRYLDALMLFNEIRLGIRSTIPLLGGLNGTGHQEGASFLLFLKQGTQAARPNYRTIELMLTAETKYEPNVVETSPSGMVFPSEIFHHKFESGWRH